MEQLLAIDTDLFILLNGLHSEWADGLMYWISQTETWIPFYIVLMYLIFRTLRSKSWVPILMVIISVVLADLTTSKLMKPYFKRPRPSHESSMSTKIHLLKETNGQYYKGGMYGFASSHAANSFALAMCFWLWFRKKWRYVGVLFFWAFVVAYSRIYLGVHYPLDIVVGALVGIGVAYLLFIVHFYFITKNQNI